MHYGAMRDSWIAWLVVMGVARTALAQAPGQLEPPSSEFLEKRVPEELATEGMVLSRRNLALQVEQIGDRWLVSLADLTTGLVVASTKVDALPEDREAAVASMTHVVATLVAQVVGRGKPPPPPQPVASPIEPARPLPAPVDDHAERDLAELRFKRQSLRFGKNYQLVATGNTVGLVQRWVAYQGDLDQELDPEDFYAKVGRPDLADSYRSRNAVKIGILVTSVVLSTASLVVLGSGISDDCDFRSNDFLTCLDNHARERHDALIEATILSGLGTVSWAAWLYLHLHPHPIDENEAKSLADRYNQNLRGQLGLPVATRHPLRLHDVRWIPYVTDPHAGLVLSARV
jgi:hypothetical protein